MRLNSIYLSVTMLLLLVSATGCKLSDGIGRMPKQASAQQDGTIDLVSSEKRAASQEENAVALASHSTTAQSMRTLQAGEDLRELIENSPGIVLVDFYADWCGPCRKQSKILDQLDAQVIKVNVDEHRNLARKYKVSSLPTLLAVKDGEVLHKKVGFTERDQIEAMLR